jgi:hypothetical protein
MRGLKGRSRRSVPLSEREISRTRMEQPDLASCDLCARAGEWLGRRSNFSVQEWEPLTDHRETKTLGGKSKTQARDTENETKTTQKKLLLLCFTSRQCETKPGERETLKELMTADTKIGQIEARFENRKLDL